MSGTGRGQRLERDSANSLGSLSAHQSARATHERAQEEHLRPSGCERGRLLTQRNFGLNRSRDPHENTGQPGIASVRSYPVLTNAHQEGRYPTLVGPYLPVYSSAMQAEDRTAPYGLRQPSLGYAQRPAARQSSGLYPVTNRPPFPPSLETAHLSANIAPPSFIQLGSQFRQRSPYKKLCNNHHLRGNCNAGDNCRYEHGVLSKAKLEELREITKGMPCRDGLSCNDELCYAGHKCPNSPCTRRNCKFPSKMHYDGSESSRGQLAMMTTTAGHDKDVGHRQEQRFKHEKREPVRKSSLSAQEELKRSIDDLMAECDPSRSQKRRRT